MKAPFESAWFYTLYRCSDREGVIFVPQGPSWCLLNIPLWLHIRPLPRWHFSVKKVLVGVCGCVCVCVLVCVCACFYMPAHVFPLILPRELSPLLWLYHHNLCFVNFPISLNLQSLVCISSLSSHPGHVCSLCSWEVADLPGLFFSAPQLVLFQLVGSSPWRSSPWRSSPWRSSPWRSSLCCFLCSFKVYVANWTIQGMSGLLYFLCEILLPKADGRACAEFLVSIGPAVGASLEGPVFPAEHPSTKSPEPILCWASAPVTHFRPRGWGAPSRLSTLTSSSYPPSLSNGPSKRAPVRSTTVFFTLTCSSMSHLFSCWRFLFNTYNCTYLWNTVW